MWTANKMPAVNSAEDNTSVGIADSENLILEDIEKTKIEYNIKTYCSSFFCNKDLYKIHIIIFDDTIKLLDIFNQGQLNLFNSNLKPIFNRKVSDHSFEVSTNDHILLPEYSDNIILYDNNNKECNNKEYYLLTSKAFWDKYNTTICRDAEIITSDIIKNRKNMVKLSSNELNAEIISLINSEFNKVVKLFEREHEKVTSDIIPPGKINR
jgi:hypothetical protein